MRARPCLAPLTRLSPPGTPEFREAPHVIASVDPTARYGHPAKEGYEAPSIATARAWAPTTTLARALDLALPRRKIAAALRWPDAE